MYSCSSKIHLHHLMDFLFSLEERTRAAFLGAAGQVLGCTYICLWAFLPLPSYCLVSVEGWFNEENQPSSSCRSLAPRRCFDEYRRSFMSIENGFVPGVIFRERVPYLELEVTDLLILSSNQYQRQFYQEAGIKTSVFIRCDSGVIELGFATSNQINMQTQITNLFSLDSIIEFQLRERHLYDQSRASSSSLSPMSLSISSPASTSNLPESVERTPIMEQVIQPKSTSNLPVSLDRRPIEQVIRPISTAIPLHEQAYQLLNRFYGSPLTNAARVDAAMTSAMLAVMSCPSSSQSGQQEQHQVNKSRGAFKPYIQGSGRNAQMGPNYRRESMLKKALAIARKINFSQISQSFHVMSERNRRLKISQSFQMLRTLLPPGTKKDKLAILATAKDQLEALQAQVSDLTEKNRELSMHLFQRNEAYEVASNSNESVVIQINRAPESTSQEREINVTVTVKKDWIIQDLVLRVLECLKQMMDVTLESIAVVQQLGYQRINLRLKIKGSEWVEASFKEVLKRAIGDVAQ